MNYKDFEQFELTPEDFAVDIINIKEFDNVYKKAVRVSIPQLNIGVDSWSKKSQIKNKERCMSILFSIVKDIFN
jgi:protein subunit release factor A